MDSASKHRKAATERLYYDDAFLREFDAAVIACEPAGNRWHLRLDRTAFYPTSGGQPFDTGKLNDVAVVEVSDEQGDEIVHVVERPIVSTEVHGVIDWQRRFDHMQQHTGQHLLSAMFQERYGLPTVSFHLGSDLCTIDLRGPEPTPDVLRGAQKAANAIIFEDRPVNVRYGTAEQLAALGVRKEVDRQGILRAIEIEGADLQPCGGTHVRGTGQIGLILVRRCTRIRQDWRVEFACGARADGLASSDFQLLRTIGERLSCAPEDALAAIDKAAAVRDAHFKSLRAAFQQLAVARARLSFAENPIASDGHRIIVETLRDENPELLLPLATELAKFDRTVALLAHAESGQLVFAQHPSAASDLPSLLKQVLAAVPGKGGGARDFVRAKLADPSRCAEALASARSLLTSS